MLSNTDSSFEDVSILRLTFLNLSHPFDIEVRGRACDATKPKRDCFVLLLHFPIFLLLLYTLRPHLTDESKLGFNPKG